ncbi:unnamed protein product [Urochloa decumbens]|uniref:DC1 domain-containing protein n=1 Tax=Urochloa decumbens TaxID=240449 RepID=A0ABC9HHK7_9POAL
MKLSDEYPAEVRHPFFPGYTLKLVVPDDHHVRDKFKCDGCKLVGAGARYECKRGLGDEVDLHISCAIAHTVPVKKIGGNEFVFRHKPTGPADETTYCDACGGDAEGFVYHCCSNSKSKHEYDLHPCCSYLRESFDMAGIFFELHMGAPPRRCRVCAKKKLGPRRRKCWTYGSVGDDDDRDEPVFLHVSCARDLGSEISFSTAVSLDVARASERLAGATSGRVVPNNAREEEVIHVRPQAMNRLLLQRRGPRRRHVSAIRVLGFIVRAVIGVIFGDPTAMIVAFAGAFSTGG